MDPTSIDPATITQANLSSVLLYTPLIGAIATAAMTLFLWLTTLLRVADVDMVRALGSFLTRSLDRSMSAGLAVHFAVGIILSFLYIYILRIPTAETVTAYAAIGGFLGALHGLVVSIALVVLVAEHHPVARFQKAGVQVALFHIVAHVVYGAVVGGLYGFWIANVVFY